MLENGSLFINSGRTDGYRRQGVGLVLSKAVRNSLISYTPISERIITARLHSQHINISVVVAYAPTEDAEDGVLLLVKPPLPHKMQKNNVFFVVSGGRTDDLFLRRSYIIAVAWVFYLNKLKKLGRIGKCMLLFQKVKKNP